MSNPKNIHDALRHAQNLVSAIETDVNAYLENPAEYEPEYFEDVRDAATEAKRMLAYIRDTKEK